VLVAALAGASGEPIARIEGSYWAWTGSVGGATAPLAAGPVPASTELSGALVNAPGVAKLLGGLMAAVVAARPPGALVLAPARLAGGVVAGVAPA
jgi:hypothetical protein